jgi:hypothetical protein
MLKEDRNTICKEMRERKDTDVEMAILAIIHEDVGWDV